MAENADPNQQSIVQHFEKSPDYKTIYATSIYGGPTINGLLCANFIMDIPALPASTVSVPDATGTRLNQVKVDYAGKLAIREVQCGILMNTDTVKLVIEWLTTNLKIIEDAQPK